MDTDTKDDLWYYIRQMDLEFLSWWQRKQPKPPPKGPTGGKNP